MSIAPILSKMESPTGEVYHLSGEGNATTSIEKHISQDTAAETSLSSLRYKIDQGTKSFMIDESVGCQHLSDQGMQNLIEIETNDLEEADISDYSDKEVEYVMKGVEGDRYDEQDFDKNTSGISETHQEKGMDVQKPHSSDVEVLMKNMAENPSEDEFSVSDLNFPPSDQQEATTIIIDVGEMKFEKDKNRMTLFYDHFANKQQEGANEADDEETEEDMEFEGMHMEPSAKVQLDPAQLPTPERCSICLEQFDNYETFLFHVKNMHPVEYIEVLKLFKCPFCTYYSKNKTSVQQHIRIHTKEKPYKCGVCGKAFNQKAGVQQHMRSHSSAKPYICHICQGRFKAASSLATHISMRHDRLRPFSCKECGVSFGHSSNLRIHMRTHTGERPYKCHYCSKSFVQQGHLRTHVRLHTGERPFTCDYCMSGFTHVGNLRQHIITQHTKDYPYVCGVCNKGFIAPGDLKRHTKLHAESTI